MKENWQEQLQTLLKCDLKTLYPLARNINRKLEFYVGPTNSGKTYNAMQKLKEANSGLYLAPLRLLALEGYEDLKESNINASLITGEEQIFSGFELVDDETQNTENSSNEVNNNSPTLF